MFKEKEETKFLAFLIFLYFFLRLFLLDYLPFIRDEALYVQMINEQLSSPSFIPTFLGYPMDWKPPVFFWIYGFFVSLLSNFDLSFEFIYRFPSVLFGSFNLILVYLLTKELSKNIDIAKVVSIIYCINFLVVQVNVSLLIDT